MKKVVLIVALLAAIGAGGYMMMNMNTDTSTAAQQAAPFPFDRDTWIANKGVFDETNNRRDMLGGALEQVSAGMSEAEVIAALGEPDDRFEDMWRYSGGPRLGFDTDELVLVVLFADGKVTEAMSSFTARVR